MASIQTSIELQDSFTDVIYGIINAVNLTVSTMEDMQHTMNADMDTSGMEGIRDEINQATIAANELNEAMQGMTAPDVNIQTPDIGGTDQVVNVDVNPVLPDPLVENPDVVPLEVQPNAPPDPVEVQVEWQADNLEVFTNTGIERFQSEVQSANNMLNTLNQTQSQIQQTASGLDILPQGATQDIAAMSQRLQTIQQRVQQISNNSLNLGTDEANAEMEQLRSQLSQAIDAQEDLNRAMQGMDVSEINSAYLRLSQTVSNTERYIRDNVDEQGRFNTAVQQGTQQANDLVGTIMKAAAAYLSIQTIGNVLNISDELTLTTARLDMMNDGLQSTQELTNMVYAAAQDARGSFGDMADVVARFGNNARDAFSSSEEVVAFANLVQKQMTIAGAGTQEASNAMLQLSQALGSGVLRGDELNSIFEQAPNLIQSIATYLDVPIGKIREMAQEGELSADVVKAAIFASADEINAKFDAMPMTWGQVWQQMQNTALIAFQPVLNRLNELANSEAFQTFVNSAIDGLSTMAWMALEVFDAMASGAQFVADNWSVIAPIVYGIVAALGLYSAVLLIGKGIMLASAAVTAIHTAMTSAWTFATFAETAAQQGLNAALAACPLTWIIALIIALIAIIYAVCQAIANMTGVANTGFGVITGGINVVIQFFKNLGLEVANIALGIGAAIAAVASNIMTAFHNAICSVQAWWYDLLSTVLSVVAGICEALNKLPFVEFDYSGITSAADDYAAKSAEAAGNKQEYTSVADAFNEGMSTFDTFQDGWATDAFNSGAEWGDGVMDGLSNLMDGFGNVDTNIPNVDDYTSGFDSAIQGSGIGEGIGNIDENTGKIKDSMAVSEEELKYMRDIAEQEAVNRYTTAEVHIDMSGMQNTVNNNGDLDGFVSGLTDAVNEAVDIITEGVHD